MIQDRVITRDRLYIIGINRPGMKDPMNLPGQLPDSVSPSGRAKC